MTKLALSASPSAIASLTSNENIRWSALRPHDAECACAPLCTRFLERPFKIFCTALVQKKGQNFGDLVTANKNIRTVPPPKKGQNFGDLVTANENIRPVLGAVLVLCCPPVVARWCQVDAHSPTRCRCQLHLQLPHRRPSCSSRPRPRGHRTTTSYVLVVPAR